MWDLRPWLCCRLGCGLWDMLVRSGKRSRPELELPVESEAQHDWVQVEAGVGIVLRAEEARKLAFGALLPLASLKLWALWVSFALRATSS